MGSHDGDDVTLPEMIAPSLRIRLILSSAPGVCYPAAQLNVGARRAVCSQSCREGLGSFL